MVGWRWGVGMQPVSAQRCTPGCCMRFSRLLCACATPVPWCCMLCTHQQPWSLCERHALRHQAQAGHRARGSVDGPGGAAGWGGGRQHAWLRLLKVMRRPAGLLRAPTGRTKPGSQAQRHCWAQRHCCRRSPQPGELEAASAVAAVHHHCPVSGGLMGTRTGQAPQRLGNLNTADVADAGGEGFKATAVQGSTSLDTSVGASRAFANRATRATTPPLIRMAT